MIFIFDFQYRNLLDMSSISAISQKMVKFGVYTLKNRKKIFLMCKNGKKPLKVCINSPFLAINLHKKSGKIPSHFEKFHKNPCNFTPCVLLYTYKRGYTHDVEFSTNMWKVLRKIIPYKLMINSSNSKISGVKIGFKKAEENYLLSNEKFTVIFTGLEDPKRKQKSCAKRGAKITCRSRCIRRGKYAH